MQISVNGEYKVVFTSAKGLMNQLSQVKEEDWKLGFNTKIKRVNKQFQFS